VPRRGSRRAGQGGPGSWAASRRPVPAHPGASAPAPGACRRSGVTVLGTQVAVPRPTKSLPPADGSIADERVANPCAARRRRGGREPEAEGLDPFRDSGGQSRRIGNADLAERGGFLGNDRLAQSSGVYRGKETIERRFFDRHRHLGEGRQKIAAAFSLLADTYTPLPQDPQFPLGT